MTKQNKNTPKQISNFSFFILFSALITNALGHSFFMITFPSLGREMGIEDIQAGLVLSLSALVITFSAPFWGRVCERHGRRKVIFIGLLAPGICLLVIGGIIKLRLELILSVHSVLMLLLLSRTLHSALAGGMMPGAQAFIADVTSTQQRAKGMGMIGAAFGIGTILGGMLAMNLGSTHALLGFVVISFLLAITSMAVWVKFPESKHIYPRELTHTSPLPYKKLWPFLAVTLLGLTVYSLLQQVTAWRLQDSFGFSSDQSIRFSGAMMMVTMAVMIITQGLVVRQLSWTPKKLIRIGASIALLAMLLATLTSKIPLLMFAMAGLGAGLGLLLPGNLAALSLRVGKNEQARVAGINGMSQGLGLALGPALGASLHQLSPQLPYALAACIFLVIFMLILNNNKQAQAAKVSKLPRQQNP